MSLAPAYPVFSALSIVLVLLPLPWHWKARNTGTLLYIAWTVVGNLVFTINTIVWAGSFEDYAPIWCDISTRIILGQSVGLTAASLCINRRLYNIATIKTVSVSASSKRREVIINLLLGIGLPVLVMVLYYVVQSRRYSIIEDIGCWPNIWNTLLAVPMILIWPIILGVASLIYCSLSIRAFLKTRQQFKQVLSNSNSGINMSRYFRLMALASTDIVFSLPFSLYLLVSNLQNKQDAWVSWDVTHAKFSIPTILPMIILKTFPSSYKVMMINIWVLPAGGFLFFIYFGLGGEALSAYKDIFFKLVAPCGIRPKSQRPVQRAEWKNQVSSLGSSTRSEVREARFPSVPDLDESDHEEKMSDDLEAGKARSIA